MNFKSKMGLNLHFSFIILLCIFLEISTNYIYPLSGTGTPVSGTGKRLSRTDTLSEGLVLSKHKECCLISLSV